MLLPTEEEKAALSAEIKADLDALAKVDNIPGWYTASFDEKSLDDQAETVNRIKFYSFSSRIY